MEGAVCKPNISAAGRKRRIMVGWVASALAVGLVALAIALHWHWYLRATLFFPAALAATGFLQASRRTCVARAAEGTFENDDFTTTKRPTTRSPRAARSPARSSATRSSSASLRRLSGR